MSWIQDMGYDAQGINPDMHSETSSTRYKNNRSRRSYSSRSSSASSSETERETEKQLNVIRMIENNLGIRYKGRSKDEARLFISDHMEESKKTQRRYNLENSLSASDIYGK